MPSIFPHSFPGKWTVIPEPADGGDALNHDSDKDLRPSERAAKRRRIEGHAESYIRGGQLFIQSAVLRGPLDEGWINPWQKISKSRGHDLQPIEAHQKINKSAIKKKRKIGTSRVAGSTKTNAVHIAKVDKKKINRENVLNRKSAAKLGDLEINGVTKPIAVGKIRKKAGDKTHLNSDNSGQVIKKSPKRGCTREVKSPLELPSLRKITEAGDFEGERLSSDVQDENARSHISSKGSDEAEFLSNSQFKWQKRRPKDKKTRSLRSTPRHLQQDTVKRYMGITRKSASCVERQESQNYSNVVDNLTSVEKINNGQSVDAKDGQDTNGKDGVKLRKNTVLACSKKLEVEGSRSECNSSNTEKSKNTTSPNSLKTLHPIASNSGRQDGSTSAGQLLNDIAGTGEKRRLVSFGSPGVPPIFAHKKHAFNTITTHDDSRSTDTMKATVSDSKANKGVLYLHSDPSASFSDERLHVIKSPALNGMHRVDAAHIQRERVLIKNETKMSFPGNDEDIRSPITGSQGLKGNASSSTNFSTQGALIAAQEAFERDILPDTQLYRDSIHKGSETHATWKDDTQQSITPFADFNAKISRRSHVNSQVAPFSTQDLFEMVSPLTSTVRPSATTKKFTGFISSPLRNRSVGRSPITMQLSSSSSKGRTINDLEQFKNAYCNSLPKSVAKNNNKLREADLADSTPGTRFIISPSGKSHETHVHSQGDFVTKDGIETILDDANSFLQSWDIETELKKHAKEVTLANSKEKRQRAILDKRH